MYVLRHYSLHMHPRQKARDHELDSSEEHKRLTTVDTGPAPRRSGSDFTWWCAARLVHREISTNHAVEESHSREERQPRAAARPRGSSRQVEQVGEALLLERRLKLVVGSLRLLEHLCVDALLLEQKRPLRHPRIHVAERGAVRRVLLSLLPLEGAPTRRRLLALAPRLVPCGRQVERARNLLGGLLGLLAPPRLRLRRALLLDLPL
mmetsp:Transcript_6691/g.22133  ORF Transcript_6691/g.22133 Transcript_6691/m.22133 type:complete len:207 (+) Transcript_6691:11-631(+)